MKTRSNRKLTVATVWTAAALLISASATGLAQGTWGTPPPPEGPPQALPTAPHDIMTSFYTDLVTLVIQRGLDKANAKLSGASVSFSAEMSSPYMTATQFRDRPNEFYANIPYNVTYTIKILSPVGPSPVITQSSNIEVSCDGWQTGSGVITSKIVFDPPYFDPEQYNNLITGALQSQIQAAMNSFPLGPVSLPTSITPQACGSLGAYTLAQTGSSDSVYWDDPHRNFVSQTQGLITTRLLQVRRLALEDRGVTPEYQAVESPYLQLWANESFTSLSLPPMVEGQTFVPADTVVTTAPLNGQLVLIANMQYSGLGLPIGQVDATFAVFNKSSNYGNGTQTLDTPKSWEDVYPPPPFGTKPIVVTTTGAGYELTLQISAPTSQLVIATPPPPPPPVRPIAPIGGFR